MKKYEQISYSWLLATTAEENATAEALPPPPSDAWYVVGFECNGVRATIVYEREIEETPEKPPHWALRQLDVEYGDEVVQWWHGEARLDSMIAHNGARWRVVALAQDIQHTGTLVLLRRVPE